MANYYYQCGYGTIGKSCDESYNSPIPLSDFPWCPSKKHTQCMDFIEDRSSAVPKHVKESTAKRGKRSLKKGGNWL